MGILPLEEEDLHVYPVLFTGYTKVRRSVSGLAISG
jgi:hypothetical protein